MPQFLQTRRWVMTRRLALIAIVVFLAFRSYGDALLSWFGRADAARDIQIVRAEFRPELDGARPAWIISLRNSSTRFTYDEIQLQATYMDDTGAVLETDRLVVKQKLPPREETVIGSMDVRDRGAATQGALKVLGAEKVD